MPSTRASIGAAQKVEHSRSRIRHRSRACDVARLHESRGLLQQTLNRGAATEKAPPLAESVINADGRGRSSARRIPVTARHRSILAVSRCPFSLLAQHIAKKSLPAIFRLSKPEHGLVAHFRVAFVRATLINSEQPRPWAADSAQTKAFFLHVGVRILVVSFSDCRRPWPRPLCASQNNASLRRRGSPRARDAEERVELSPARGSR